MIKVGDRVRVYDWHSITKDEIYDGKVINKDLNKGKYTLFNVEKPDKECYWVFAKQCRKLIKRKKPKFKVGDRVHVFINDGELNIDLKGTIEKVDTAPILGGYYYKLKDKDEEGWFREDCLKRLVKKKVEFKVGDRVNTPSHGKGTIKNIFYSIFYEGDAFEVCLDKDHELIVVCAKTQLRKLIKKKPQFKVGDRVIVNNVAPGVVMKGILKSIDNTPIPRPMAKIILDNGNPLYIFLDNLIKLVKNKKEQKSRSEHVMDSSAYFTYKGGENTDLISDIIKNAWESLEWNKKPIYDFNGFGEALNINSRLNNVDKRLNKLELNQDYLHKEVNKLEELYSSIPDYINGWTKV